MSTEPYEPTSNRISNEYENNSKYSERNLELCPTLLEILTFELTCQKQEKRANGGL